MTGPSQAAASCVDYIRQLRVVVDPALQKGYRSSETKVKRRRIEASRVHMRGKDDRVFIVLCGVPGSAIAPSESAERPWCVAAVPEWLRWGREIGCANVYGRAAFPPLVDETGKCTSVAGSCVLAMRGTVPNGAYLRGKSCWCLVLRKVFTSPLPPFEGGPSQFLERHSSCVYCGWLVWKCLRSASEGLLVRM